jgi:hypothetical protein
MRTRIALVAIIPIALITVTLLALAATAQPARASIQTPQVASTHRTDQLTAFVSTDSTSTTTKATSNATAPAKASTATTTLPDLHLAIARLTGHPAGTNDVVPVIPPPPPAPVVVDTVTSAQRAAWDRVAMCEEGGNWQADGSRFSGGLGISRSNWSIYGGLQYASSASQATPDQQIMVAQRIQYSPPDQYGCASW